jgi:hypothetical protein
VAAYRCDLLDRLAREALMLDAKLRLVAVGALLAATLINTAARVMF